MDLPLDIKFKIASFDINTWIRLSYIDDEFKQFSYGIGRKLFIDLFTIIDKGSSGTYWKIFDKYHREDDSPAIIYNHGTQEWYLNGKKHRDNDLPAIIHTNDYQEWYINDKLHRDNDQPAIINKYYSIWCQNGSFHRDDDKPAIICKNGDIE